MCCPAAANSASAEGEAEPARDSGKSGVGTAERPAVKPRPTRSPEDRGEMDALPPFRVLLHNDPHNDMVYVVESLVEVTPLTRKPATRIMLEAHMRGLSEVMRTHRERAELYRDRIRSKGLTATIEPIEGD